MKSITASVYADKVYGAWAGKCAGGIIGAKQENNKSVLHYGFHNIFPDKFPPNDDFDLQILYLQEVLEKKGFGFDSADLAAAFAAHNRCWANEYRVAIKNIDCGILPPASGVFCNDFFKDSNGCPIRSELWGITAFGNPALACRFVEMDGSVDHGAEAVTVEKFLASAESLAFFESDIPTLLQSALAYIPENSEAAGCVRLLLDIYKVKTAAAARAELVRRYGSSDASYSVVNLGIVLIALLYGKGDFNDTMITAVNCGYDTDCTAATAGSILGIILGKSGISPAWLERIGESFVIGTVDIERQRNTLTQLTQDTVALGYALCRDGLNDAVITGYDPACCNVPSYEGRITAQVVYDGPPSLAPGAVRRFSINLTNNAKVAYIAQITAEMPQNIIVELDRNAVSVPALGTAVVGGSARLKAGAGLPVRNKGALEIVWQDGSARYPFGFMGEAAYKLYGPYFDNYDTTIHSSDPSGEEMPKDLFTMFNGFADINREYVADDDPEGEEYDVFYSAEDKIPVEEHVRYRGPCCVYLTREFIAEKETDVHLLLGYSAPYRVYVNGEKVAWHEGKNVCWMPLNNAVEIKLKKGRNKITYKLVRTSGKFEFSAILSRKNFGEGVLVDFINIQP